MSSYPTPMIAPLPNLRVKLEHLNPAGSHKARAARRIIRKAVADGELRPGCKRRIIEKSGGNFGIGLAYEANKYDIGVDLVISPLFSPIKRRLCEEFGARLVGSEFMACGMKPREVIDHILQAQKDDYFFTDQFSNQENIKAHLHETAPEIIEQITDDDTRFSGITIVLSAGTGAHAASIQSVMSEAFKDVRTVIIEPENCRFADGIYGCHSQHGAAVGVAPPFLDLAKVNHFEPVGNSDAVKGQRLLAAQAGIYGGPTSGANYISAYRMALKQVDRLFVTIVYDSGESYLSSAQLS